MNVKQFIEDFFQRNGAKVFNAMFLAKIIGFGVSLAMIKILTQESYGDFTYAFTAVSFLIPFMGFGAYQSLVYFGAQLKSEQEKKKLFAYSFSKGILFSVLLALLLIIFSPLITIKRPNSLFLLIVLSLHVLSFTLVEFIRNYTRLIDRNDIFARSENYYNIILFIIAVIGALLAGATGYAWALVITPFLVGAYYLKKLNLAHFKFNFKDFTPPTHFWRYGLFVSLGAVAAKMMYIVDIMTIGNIMGSSHLVITPQDFNLAIYISEQTAIYRVCSIIPIATFVLPLSLITTDFVSVSKNSKNKIYLKKYANNSIKVLFPISIIVAALLHFGRDWVLWLFGTEYYGHGELISVFSLAIIGAFTFRIPFGNLISAVGKANWNAYISFGVLALNVVLNYYFVKNYGIIGAAWVTTILIWFSGLVNYFVYRYYLNSLK